MRLHPEHFEKIKSEKKKTEIRLNDPKRKNIKVGDTIVFLKRPNLKDKIKVKVTARKDYSKYPKLPTYYTKEQEKEFGVVVFGIKLIE